ncbi:hypothetical protein AVEN_81269-1 [Araneus ventricosus]|uniref:Uncharacterized protein n=1 Tax=Araneus ventricosus TaxID=182803 RepID=A0A4Y2FHL0_ARAVE|nr:hypothetical protein AVEN_81269-1 [Araneus ventricosus]
MESYDVWICHQGSPVTHHHPFSREIENTLLHCTFSMGKAMTESSSPNHQTDFDNFYFIWQLMACSYVIKGRLPSATSIFERNRKITTPLYILYGVKQ